jgi:hypothetical protein
MLYNQTPSVSTSPVSECIKGRKRSLLLLSQKKKLKLMLKKSKQKLSQKIISENYENN